MDASDGITEENEGFRRGVYQNFGNSEIRRDTGSGHLVGTGLGCMWCGFSGPRRRVNGRFPEMAWAHHGLDFPIKSSMPAPPFGSLGSGSGDGADCCQQARTSNPGGPPRRKTTIAWHKTTKPKLPDDGIHKRGFHG